MTQWAENPEELGSYPRTFERSPKLSSLREDHAVGTLLEMRFGQPANF